MHRGGTEAREHRKTVPAPRVLVPTDRRCKVFQKGHKDKDTPVRVPGSAALWPVMTSLTSLRLMFVLCKVADLD